jgi:very-short-patch-repair endonuclease
MDKVSKARELRRDGSRAEKICWHLIRDRRINGVKFRRQHPIGPYFADFACLSKKLIIEIDGEHHAFRSRRMHVGRPSWNARDGGF